MEGPLLLHHRKPTPSQTTAVSRQCDADGRSYGWSLGPQARWTAWSANSLARSSTPRSRSQSVPNTHHRSTASRFRPLNTGGAMAVKFSPGGEGFLEMFYPIYLDLTGRRVVVVGGGEVAERKTESLLDTGASVLVISPEVTPHLAALADQKRIELRRREYSHGDCAGAALIFSATDDPEVSRNVYGEAMARG